MKNRVLALVLIFLAIFSMIATYLFLIASGKISPFDICGFGVDSSNNIYIGKEKYIEVYADGEFIRKFVPLTSRAYCFVVNEDDTITIGRYSDSKALSTDLYGENVVELDGIIAHDVEIQTMADIVIEKNGKVFKFKSALHKNRVIERNGSVYQWKQSAWGGLRPYSILRDGEMIYSMPVLDYLFGFPYKALLVLLFLAGALLISPFSGRNDNKAI